MDPTAVLLAMITAARDGARATYDEQADWLYRHLLAGGELPPALSALVRSLPQPSLFA